MSYILQDLANKRESQPKYTLFANDLLDGQDGARLANNLKETGKETED